MEKFLFEISIADDLRIDRFLAQHLSHLSRSRIQRLINDGYILVNAQKVKTNYRLQLNDRIVAEIPQIEKIKIEPEDRPLDIIYEDDDLLVVNKEVGMIVHPAAGINSGTLVNALLAHCQQLSNINGWYRPGIVHRLDRDTSGLLVVAKNNEIHEALKVQLQQHRVKRIYWGLTEGVIIEPGGIIEAPIGRHSIDRQKRAVTDKNSKRALTKYLVKERFLRNTLVECQLETGRTHQIRVHLAYIKHPLVGDPLYGYRKQRFDFPGQALHARCLGFKHPGTNKYLEFEATLPVHWHEILKLLRNEGVQYGN